ANVDYKKRLILNLSKLEYPHLIPDIPKLALEQASRIASLRKELPQRAQKIGNLFYADAKGDSASVIANLLLDICDAAIGIGYDTDEQTRTSDLSIRGADKVRVDLGKKTAKLARNFGGTGGGHPKASGARIPALRLMEFLQILSNQVK
ncbi:DHH family phosphoesterase, partial [Candidatus Bathyarchaeota archaeon]|nr:DHH family phosphoesterase [Candidatus Bathyarchaeota archaeon]